MTFDPVGFLAMYEEDLHVGLHFPLHPFIHNILQQYDVIPTQLSPYAFQVLASFVILYHFCEIQPRILLFIAFF